MHKPKLYLLFGIVIIFLIIGLSLLGFEMLSTSLELLIVPLLTIFYLKFTKKTSKRFSAFLILFSIGDFINFLGFDSVSTSRFYITSLIYMIAFLFLMSYILKTINPKKLLKNYSIDLVLLILLNVYMVYVFINVVIPDDFEERFLLLTQIVEISYNVFLIVLVSLSFINYIQNTISKYLILFLGSLCLAFSELILMAYYYLIDDIRLSYISTLFYFSGFLLLIYESREMFVKKNTINFF